MTLNDKKIVSLMFSGGLDSTTAAINLALDYDKVHLLTYYNGYGHFYIKNSERRAKELSDKINGKFTHSIISIEKLFKEMVIEKLPKDYEEYKSGFIWCLGCKMCMHTRSIIYNQENNIAFMADGSSKDSEEMVEQMALSVSLVYKFYEKYGINYYVPVYKTSREEKIKILKNMNFRMGLRVGDRFLGVQPKCIPGELYYLPYLLFNKAMSHKEDLVSKFIERKIVLADRYITGRFKNG